MPSKKTLPDFGVINPAITRKDGCFAAAGRAKERNKLLIVDVKGKFVQDSFPVKNRRQCLSVIQFHSFLLASPFAEFSPTSGLLDAGSPAFPGGSAPIMPPRKRFVTPPQTRQLQQHIQRQCVLMFNQMQHTSFIIQCFGGLSTIISHFSGFYNEDDKKSARFLSCSTVFSLSVRYYPLFSRCRLHQN